MRNSYIKVVCVKENSILPSYFKTKRNSPENYFILGFPRALTGKNEGKGLGGKGEGRFAPTIFLD